MMLRKRELQERIRRGRRKLLRNINVNSSGSNTDGNFLVTAAMTNILTLILENLLGLKSF
jgi:hypothetical protein